MSIITENQKVKADLSLSSGLLHIEFEEDPSYIRSEIVLVDLMRRSIGIIFESAYHHIGDLPRELDGATGALLQGHGAGGKAVRLHAPIKYV